MRYLLDTNSCISAMQRKARVVARMAAAAPGELAISTITSFELFTGVEKCAQPARELAKVNLFLSTVQVFEFTEAAAKMSARVRAALETVGTPIGPYDTLLAGQALTMGLILVTSNTREFNRVAKLVVEDWNS